MTIKELLSESTLNKFKEDKATYEEINFLIEVTRKVLMKDLDYSCKNCYTDALIELNVMYNNNKRLFDQRMSGQRYILKRGCVFQLGFGSSRMLARQNCTEELALEFLSKDKNNIVYFEKYPTKDWEKEVDDFIKKNKLEHPVEQELSKSSKK